MAGEMVTITSTEDWLEAEGRTQLLQRIVLWKLRFNVTWAQIRNTYAHIIRKIENCEITWEADWDQFERHIYDKIATPGTKAEKLKKSVGQSEFTWFCKPYQKPDRCTCDSPHNDTIKGKTRLVHHICAACIQKDKAKRYHSESSPDCPMKEL